MTDTATTERYKTNLTLPDEVKADFQGLDPATRNAYIADLRTLGWTLSSIAEAAGVTRERVRQIARDHAGKTSGGFDLALPVPPAKPVKTRTVYVEPSEDSLARLLELQPKAQLYRAGKLTDPEVKEAAEEYTALIYSVMTEEKVPLYRLAKRLGVTHGALRFRLARYGYINPPTATSKAYRTLKS